MTSTINDGIALNDGAMWRRYWQSFWTILKCRLASSVLRPAREILGRWLIATCWAAPSNRAAPIR